MSTLRTTQTASTAVANKPKRRRLGSLIGAGAIAVGAMILTAPPAYADIKSDCVANGGHYSDYVAPDGTHFEWCCLYWPTGGQSCISYMNGEELRNAPGGQTPTRLTPAPGAIPPPVAAQ